MREQAQETYIADRAASSNNDGQMSEQDTVISSGNITEDFSWILDDNLLRDEGVRYGLVGAAVEHKMTTISNYYDRKIAEAEQSAVNNQQWHGKLAEEKIIQEEKRDRLREEITALATSIPRSNHQFFRFAVMLVAYTLMVVFCFFAIYEWMGDSWVASLLITIGVYVLGGFSMYYRTAIMYNAVEDVKSDSKRELWKSHIEEFILPAIAALFILLWGDKEATIGQTIIFFFMIYALLLFSGRGLLKSFFSSVDAYGILREDQRRKKRNAALLREKQSEYDKCLQVIDDISKTLLNLEAEIRQSRLDIVIFEKIQQAKINCFMSEYELAKMASRNMTDRERNSLTR
jgi:hypothetical protein